MFCFNDGKTDIVIISTGKRHVAKFKNNASKSGVRTVLVIRAKNLEPQRAAL